MRSRTEQPPLVMEVTGVRGRMKEDAMDMVQQIRRSMAFFPLKAVEVTPLIYPNLKTFQYKYVELELNIKFPTCWDGVNVEAVDQSHVSYALECGEDFNECFDFDCPESHPVRMPEIHLYVRILNYEGGAHMFANETDVSYETSCKA